MAESWQERRALAYGVILLLALLLVTPGLVGQPFLHDSHALNLVWADQFTAELRRGNPYPRWLPDSHDGLGSPTFYFCPPLAFYVAGLFGLLGLSTYGSLMAAFATFFALSGVGMWHWLRGSSHHPLGGAILFTLLPYHLFNFVVRGAFAESLGIALLPFVALGLRRIKQHQGGALLGLSYGTLILSHLPLALLTSFFVIAPYALWHRQRLWHFAPPLALGIGLGTIFLFPALGLEPYRDAAQLYANRHLRAEYWSLWHFEVGSGKLPYWILCGFIALPMLLLAAQTRGLWAKLGTILTLLAAGVIPYFWSLPLLEKVQFPWRTLGLAEFALVTALARVPAVPASIRLSLLPAALFSLFTLGAHNLYGGKSTDPLLSSYSDVLEMLPPGVVPAERNVLVLPPGSIHQGRVPPPSVPGKIVEPVFYFPRWSCGEIEPRTKLLMHPPDCTPEPLLTSWEKVGLLFSLLSLVGIGGLALLARRRPPQPTS